MLTNSQRHSVADHALILDADLLVIDIESCPLDREDPLNSLVARPRNQVFLNTITAVAVLTIERTSERRLSLESFTGSEREILSQLDVALQRNPTHALLTFNGTRFDLPLLQVRALNRGLVNLRGIGSVKIRDHVDLFRTTGHLTSLEALAGALNLLDTIESQGVRPEQKCRSDVVLTYLAAVHLAAFAAGHVERIGEALRDCAMLTSFD